MQPATRENLATPTPPLTRMSPVPIYPWFPAALRAEAEAVNDGMQKLDKMQTEATAALSAVSRTVDNSKCYKTVLKTLEFELALRRRIEILLAAQNTAGSQLRQHAAARLAEVEQSIRDQLGLRPETILPASCRENSPEWWRAKYVALDAQLAGDITDGSYHNQEQISRITTAIDDFEKRLAAEPARLEQRRRDAKVQVEPALPGYLVERQQQAHKLHQAAEELLTAK